jgi:hypothetical protein
VRENVFGFLREGTVVASLGNSHTFGRIMSLSDERLEVQFLEYCIVSTGSVTDVPEECAAFISLNKQCRI